jgi:short-subunit dehydrogenase
MDVLQGKHITIFFNNAAATGSKFSLFDCYTDEQIEDTLNIGVVSITKLLRQVLPILITNAPSALLNVGSAAGVNAVPYISTYAASKGYLLVYIVDSGA